MLDITTNPPGHQVIIPDNAANASAPNDLTGRSDKYETVLNYAPNPSSQEAGPIVVYCSSDIMKTPTSQEPNPLIDHVFGDTGTWFKVTWSNEGKGEQSIMFDSDPGGALVIAANAVHVQAVQRGRGTFRYRAHVGRPWSIGGCSALRYSQKIINVVGGGIVGDRVPKWAVKAWLAVQLNANAQFRTASSSVGLGGSPAPSGQTINQVLDGMSRTDDGTSAAYQIGLTGYDRIWQMLNVNAAGTAAQNYIVSFELLPGVGRSL